MAQTKEQPIAPYLLKRRIRR